jgi:hypothetical protein
MTRITTQLLSFPSPGCRPHGSTAWRDCRRFNMSRNGHCCSFGLVKRPGKFAGDQRPGFLWGSFDQRSWQENALRTRHQGFETNLHK